MSKKTDMPSYDAPDQPRHEITVESVARFETALLSDLRQQVAAKDITEAEAAEQAKRCGLKWEAQS